MLAELVLLVYYILTHSFITLCIYYVNGPSFGRSCVYHPYNFGVEGAGLVPWVGGPRMCLLGFA